MGQTVRLAIAQMESVLGDVEANLDIVADFVRRAEKERADLVLFPELCLAGYPPGDWIPEASIRPGSRQIERLKKLSGNVSLAIGLVEETEDVEFFNTALYLAGGEIRHVHRKIYLPNYRHFDEKRHFMHGWRARAFRTPWCRMAMLVCGDCWHLSVPYMAANDGADVLLVLAASSREGLTASIDCQDAWIRLNRTNALTLSTFVAFANHVGVQQGLHYFGSSHVALPDGNLLARAGEDRAELLVAELDLRELRRQRLILPFRRDDSLALTVDLGQRVLARKTNRRHGFMRVADHPSGPGFGTPGAENAPIEPPPANEPRGAE